MFGLASFLFVGIGIVSAEVVKPVPTLMAVPVRATGTVPVVNPNQNNPQGPTLRDKYNKQLRDLKGQYKEGKANALGVATTARAAAKDKVAAVKERLAAKNQERIKASAERMIDRYYRALARIGSAKERIQSHIEKMEEKGIDLSEAKALMPMVDQKIEEAMNQLAQVKEDIEAMFDSEDPKSIWKEAKGSIASAKEAVKEAHKALRDAIIAIKSSVKTDSHPSNTGSDDQDEEDEGENNEDGDGDDQATTTEETQ